MYIIFFQIVGVLLCIAGVLCTLQPWREIFKPTLVEILLGYTVACLGGVFLSADIFIVRHYPYLHDKHHQDITLFWMFFTGTLISGISSICFEDIQIYYSPADWILIAGHCLCYGPIMSMYMYACAHVPGLIMALIRCTIAVYLLGAQYTIMADDVHGGNHNVLEVVGAVLVVTGSTLPAVVQAFKIKESSYQDDQK